MSQKNGDSRPWIVGLHEEKVPITPINHNDRLPSDAIGLAFSGGGIRSASFCLGVLQSLTKHGWLPHIDYLSTVSGGGYIGTYLGRFFDQCRAPSGIAGPLPNQAPGGAQSRIANELGDSRSASISWLRRNANYLAPTGFGEAMFNFAAFWRNFLSLHFVLGIFFFALYGLANALSYCPHFPKFSSFAGLLAGGLAPIGHSLLKADLTPWLACGEITIWLAVLPLAIAYWLVSQDYHERFVLSSFTAMLVLAVAVTIGLGQPLALLVFATSVGWVILAWYCIQKIEGHGNPLSLFRLALARNQLTYLQSFWTAVSVCTLALGGIDFAGRYLAHSLLFEGGHRVASHFVAIGASFVALGPMLRGLSMLATTGNHGSDSWLATLIKIPYLSTVLMLLIGVALPLTLISWACHVTYGLGSSYFAGVGATLVALLISWLLGWQEALPFVNRSGPLTIYAARLARVFMGAVNPVRLRHNDGDNITAVIEGDDVPMIRYAPHEAGGPLHLFNVAVNETVDVASQRGMRDRQAENMAIGPAGISVSRKWHSFWEVKNDARTAKLKPLGNPNESHPFLTDDGQLAETESLSVRQWMAISGAALSPGLGRLTSTSLSLLFTLSNLRLGYWWDSGIWSRERLSVPIREGIFESVTNAFKRIFAAQSLLVAELRGQFSGPWRRRFYLSDGGNFENTGAYELLRRRVPLIVMCDAGRDQLHQATGIADLTRIARIDFGAEIETLSDDAKELETMLSKIGVPTEVVPHLGTLDDLLGGVDRLPKKHAVLLRVCYPQAVTGNVADPWNGRNESWILYLKLTMTGDETADVRNYKMTHPDFPNESTLDQFFDEPQWESYRKLGEHIGNKLFS